MKVAFVNVWGGFSLDDNFFTNVIKEIYPSAEFDLGLNDKKYDLAISLMPNFACHNPVDMKNISCKKLCFTGESYSFLEHTPHCDAYIGFDYPEDMPSDIKYMRFPLYALYHCDHMRRYKCSSYDELREKFFIQSPKEKFSAVVSNPGNAFRTSIIKYLVKNSLCDSGGSVENNVGEIGWSFDAKFNFSANCKYALAFENTAKKGYITEKIYEAFMVGSVPYYWGAPDIHEEFNPDSYFTFDASTEEKMQESIKLMVERLDENVLYHTMRNCDPFTGFKSENYIKNGKEIMKNFIQELMETK
jgi:hypothetical protein